MAEDGFLEELAAMLFAHNAEAQAVGYAPRDSSAFQAKPHECHSNVDRWVAEHPECAVVRGWLIYDYTLGVHPVVRFQAHSVLEENGRLVDITPNEARQRPPFLRHPEGNEMFDLTVSKRRIVSVTHRLRPGS